MGGHRILYIKLERNNKTFDSNDYIARAHYNISSIWNTKGIIGRNNEYYNTSRKSLPYKDNIFRQNITQAVL
jgi:hypothetical protein